jgi:hypothetical protein
MTITGNEKAKCAHSRFASMHLLTPLDTPITPRNVVCELVPVNKDVRFESLSDVMQNGNRTNWRGRVFCNVTQMQRFKSKVQE